MGVDDRLDVRPCLEDRGMDVVGLALKSESITWLPSMSYFTTFDAVTCSMNTFSALTRKCSGFSGSRTDMWL